MKLAGPLVVVARHRQQRRALRLESVKPGGGLHGRHGGSQRQQVAVDAKAAYLAAHDVGEHRHMAKRLARMDVGHVHLNDRALQNRQRVADGVAVVRPGAGIDQYRVHAFAMGAVDALAHLAFDVGLEAFDFGAQFLAQRG